MRRCLQLIGPVTIFCVVVAAEAAMYALGQSPSSEALWYINVELFGAFRRSHHFLSSSIDIPYLQFFVALPLIGLAIVGLTAKGRLMLAISSNLSFVYASFLVYSWFNIASAPGKSLRSNDQVSSCSQPETPSSEAARRRGKS